MDIFDMRIIVLILALLATGKVVASEYTQRTKLKTAVIEGHRDRAAQICHREGKTLAVQLPASTWAKPEIVRLRFGNPAVAAALWDIDSPRWLARYRNPILLLTVGQSPAQLNCAFDVATGAATVLRR